jgi:hypothetical protein
MRVLIASQPQGSGFVDRIRQIKNELFVCFMQGKLPAAVASLPVVAIVNGGGISDSIPKGAITEAQLKKVLPFPDQCVIPGPYSIFSSLNLRSSLGEEFDMQ